jgi:hypothetical protein
MKIGVLLALFIVYTNCFGAEHENMVSFGRSGVGWTVEREDLKTNEGSIFQDVNYFLNDISLSYARRLGSNLQLGVSYKGLKREFVYINSRGEASSNTIHNNEFGAFSIYNFSKKFLNSWFLGIGASVFNQEDEKSSDFADAEGKSPIEVDDTGFKYEVFFGKRFLLKALGFEQLTYSFSAALFYREHGKDFKDQDTIEGVGLALHLIKFDVFF